MKKLILICCFILVASITFAQNYAIKISAAMIPVSTSASEIVLEEGNSNLTLEGYQGNGDGYELEFAILLSHLEFSYFIQQYSISKNADGEIGNLSFSVESPGFSVYLNDPLDNPGFNMNLGLGKGIARLNANKEVNGTTMIEKDSMAYARELHYFLGVHVGFWDMYGLTIKKMFQNLKTVTGKEFTNDYLTIGLYAQF